LGCKRFRKKKKKEKDCRVWVGTPRENDGAVRGLGFRERPKEGHQ